MQPRGYICIHFPLNLRLCNPLNICLIQLTVARDVSPPNYSILQKNSKMCKLVCIWRSTLIPHWIGLICLAIGEQAQAGNLVGAERDIRNWLYLVLFLWTCGLGFCNKKSFVGNQVENPSMSQHAIQVKLKIVKQDLIMCLFCQSFLNNCPYLSTCSATETTNLSYFIVVAKTRFKVPLRLSFELFWMRSQ